MSHRNPNLTNPELAAVLAELVTAKVAKPPRGYGIVERIALPDGSVLHESSQYSFAPVVASWLWTHGYRAGKGAVAARRHAVLGVGGEAVGAMLGAGDLAVAPALERLLGGQALQA